MRERKCEKKVGRVRVKVKRQRQTDNESRRET